VTYTTFNQVPNNALLEPMFLGNGVNVARYDQQRHPMFEKLTEKQLSFFWRPEEVDIATDRADWQKLTTSEKHIFISNLKYQTLLDSVAARSVNAAFLPLVSLPELETWIETHGFAETIHSRSYTHILRNLFTDPSEVFDDIVVNPAIIERATSITRYLIAPFAQKSNPIPWINAHLVSDNVQVAPQESEISSYLVGQVDADVDDDAFEDFKL